jgi:HEAT repeat protein
MTQSFSSIIQDLQHPDINTRSRAVFDLDALGDDKAILDELLSALANEKDLLVREDITWALVRRKKQSIQPLIDCLNSENAQLRHNAAHTLGKIASPLATDALIALLRDKEAFVVSKTALALRQIGDERAIPALVEVLGHENREVQTMLLEVLESFGEKAIPTLAQALETEDWQKREQAADVLGHIHSEESLQLLSNALKDTVWQVRFAAVTALAYHGAKSVIQSLANDPHERVRSLVASILARA